MGASPLRAILRRFSSAARQPLARAALTSAVVMTAGDVLCQVHTNQKRSHQLCGHSHSSDIYTRSLPFPLLNCSACRVDWGRAARFGLIGLTLHGPLFYHGFRTLDTRIGAAPTLKLVRCSLARYCSSAKLKCAAACSMLARALQFRVKIMNFDSGAGVACVCRQRLKR